MNNRNRISFFTLDIKNYIETNNPNIYNLSELLNKNKLVILSGMKNIGKINFLKEFINNTHTNNNYFYFNKSDDIENKINNAEDLDNLLNDYIQLYKNPSFIVLQNISKIEGIKGFIGKIYKGDFKIILIGNNIKIGGINEIEILNNKIISNENLNNLLKYGSINEIEEISSEQLKEKFLKLTTNDIFLNDIFLNFSVKSINLYKFTMAYLAENNIFVSLRELQKNLNNVNNISLKTTIDYIDFSIQAKIIKRVYRFDIKTSKAITSKAKYYFTDNGIRNSLINFNLNKDLLIENLIFNKLEYNNFDIYSGLNGKFEFSFYGEKTNEKIYIHISKEISKDGLKKEVNKLLKIGNEGRKYLLVDSIEKFGIKKVKYDSVYIIETVDFLEKFGQK